MTPTETRRSFLSPVPPPPNVAQSYDETQMDARRVICRGCGRELCAPARVESSAYVCPECAK